MTRSRSRWRRFVRLRGRGGGAASSAHGAAQRTRGKGRRGEACLGWSVRLYTDKEVAMKNDVHNERMLMLRYACERVARGMWKSNWRLRARQMERAALVECVRGADISPLTGNTAAQPQKAVTP